MLFRTESATAGFEAGLQHLHKMIEVSATRFFAQDDQFRRLPAKHLVSSRAARANDTVARGHRPKLRSSERDHLADAGKRQLGPESRAPR